MTTDTVYTNPNKKNPAITEYIKKSDYSRTNKAFKWDQFPDDSQDNNFE